MERKDYTVEVYKMDRRTKAGQRLVIKQDHKDIDLKTLKHLYETTYFKKDGYVHAYHETYVTRRSLMGGKEYQERYDTPYFCSPSSESYWSM